MDKLNRLCVCRLAILYVDNLKTIDVQAKPARGGNLAARARLDDETSWPPDGTAQEVSSHG
jgi:hypothetical protein